ncbi:glutathione S-transferase 1-1-like [Andrena cerasifolii]|uniref:glutathione S-transferase 1-1-like n=1 Tax=Andrena cerasifolii TaxID=2819439 RepID=UPI004037B377
MPKIVLYAQEVSPPCRAVLLAAHAIGLDLEVREVDLAKQEQLSDEFVKLNPQHTIPTIDDNGFILTDSHAIICYLADKYAKDDSLYPKDAKKRALVNQYLYFDTGEYFGAMKNAFRPVFLGQVNTISEEKSKALNNAYETLNRYLEGKKWLLGDSYTLADISIATTASSGAVTANLDDYPNVKGWLERCEKELPGYKERNLPGTEQLHAILRSRLG